MSYCVVCDAEPGGCTHNANRYVADIIYEPNGAGGWKVPAHERANWAAEPQRPAKPAAGNDVPAKELSLLFEELDGPIYLDAGIKHRLEEVYELNPVRVTRLTTWFLANATGQDVRNPAGILYKRLGEIELSET